MAGLIEKGEDFLESMGMKFAEGSNQLVSAGNEARERHRRVMEKWNHLRKVGYEVVTIVNCLPWQIEVDICGKRYELRGADLNKKEMFYAKTIKFPVMDMCDMGDGKYAPEPILPVEIAMEFERKYATSGESEEADRDKPGGVFFYKGSDSQPPVEMVSLVEKAQEQMDAWMRLQFNAANDSWFRFNKQTRFISDRMRDAADYIHKKYGEPLPEWRSLIRNAVKGTKACPNCAEDIKAAAQQCRFCGAVLKADGGFERTGEFVAQPPTKAAEPEQQQVAPSLGEDVPSEEDILNDRVKGEVPPATSKPRGSRTRS